MSPEGPLSILHVTSPGEVGGLERVVHALARGQQQAGHRVRVAAILNPTPVEHPFLTPLTQAGVEVAEIRLGFRAYRAEREAIRKVCLAERPDVIHTHGYRSDVLEIGVARTLQIPAVTTLHGSSSMGGVTALYDVAQLLSLWRFAAVVAVSRRIAATLPRWGVRRSRIHVIPNAWSGQMPALDRGAARRELGAPGTGYLVGFVGRLIRIKGCDLFIRAMAQCSDLPIHGVVVGDGPERPGLEALAESLGIRDRITFAGGRQEASQLYSAFDLWALCSRSEGIPLVLFEAVAAGVPVVATTVGGIPEVVAAEQAILVPPEDPGALSAAIRRSVLDPVAAGTRARAAAQRIREEFGASRWLERYDTVYRSILREARAS